MEGAVDVGVDVACVENRTEGVEEDGAMCCVEDGCGRIVTSSSMVESVVVERDVDTADVDDGGGS